MRVEDFDKIVEMWKKHILSDVLKDYKLEIDEDIPKEFAAIALYLDSSTVRDEGEVLEYYDSYRQAA